MTAKVSHHQYRTLGQTYLFQVKSEETVTLKIYDISRQRLSKTSLSINPFEISTLFEKPRAITLLALFEEKASPSSAPSIPALFQDVLSELGKIIDLFKSKIPLENKQVESLTCPITLEVFRKPVIDSCGHTFEKYAIEQHLSVNAFCPISHKPISVKNLVPNREVQRMIETCQPKDAIPTFSLFRKANKTLASRNLEMAQAYVEEQEYQSALDSYSQAFQFTCLWQDYQPIPLLFQKMNEPQKAQLSTLYLIKYQLAAEEYDEALRTLESLVQETGLLHDIDTSIQIFLINLYIKQGNLSKALPLAMTTAQTCEKSLPQKAIVLYEYLLHHDPTQWQIYNVLSDLLSQPQEKSQCLLKGACHAIEEEDYSRAEEFCKRAEETLSHFFLDHLIYLSSPSAPELRLKKMISLAKIYQAEKDHKQLIKVYKYTLRDLSTCQTIVIIPKIVQMQAQFSNPEKIFRWAVNLFQELLREKKYEVADVLAQEVRVLLSQHSTSDPVSIYKHLVILYTYQKSPKLQDALECLGKAYLDQGNFILAEEIYREAFKKFPSFEQAIALAGVLEKEEGKISEAVKIYYDAASLSIFQGRFDHLNQVFAQLFHIDPLLQHLQMAEKTYLFTQKHLCQLSQQLEQTQSQVLSLSKELALVKGEIIKLSAENERLWPLNSAGRERALLKAAASGDLVFARQLIMHEVNVNTINLNGETPLILAAEKGYSAIVQMLIDSGADIHAERSKSYYPPKNNGTEVAKTAVEIATHKGHNEIVRILVNEGAKLTRTPPTYSQTQVVSPPLFEAIRQNNIELITLFVENGLDLFITSSIENVSHQVVPLLEEALKCAISAKHADSCRYLLSFYNDHGRLDFSQAPRPYYSESQDREYCRWHEEGKNMLEMATVDLEIFKLLLENKVADLNLPYKLNPYEQERLKINNPQFGHQLCIRARYQGRDHPVARFLVQLGFDF